MDFFHKNRVSAEWAEKTNVFLKEILRKPMVICPSCPCATCGRRILREKSEMTMHLRTYGFMPNFPMPINFAQRNRDREEVMRQRIGGYEDDGVRDMLDDVRAAHTIDATHSENEPEEPEETAKAFLDILASSRKPLYEGAKLSQLDDIS